VSQAVKPLIRFDLEHHPAETIYKDIRTTCMENCLAFTSQQAGSSEDSGSLGTKDAQVTP
jgi:hypothetical protein